MAQLHSRALSCPIFCYPAACWLSWQAVSRFMIEVGSGITSSSNEFFFVVACHLADGLHLLTTT